jgi:hypothetical protein
MKTQNGSEVHLSSSISLFRFFRSPSLSLYLFNQSIAIKSDVDVQKIKAKHVLAHKRRRGWRWFRNNESSYLVLSSA